jgi:hypothetical protein
MAAMRPHYRFAAVLTLVLVLGVPRYDAELHEDSYSTLAANGGTLVQQRIKEQATPDEDAYVDDPGEGVMKTPKHPWDADRISP